MDTEDVHIEPYNPGWPKKFESEAKLLWEILNSDNIVNIEHFGSTAVPGLSAKPIIDILIGVKSLSEAKKFIPILERLGYSYWGDDPRKDGYYLVKGLPPNGPRTFHIHITEIGSERWGRLLFRDYLIKHPEEVREYEKLKLNLAEKYKNDREAYTEAKGEYVKSVMEKARKEFH